MKMKTGLLTTLLCIIAALSMAQVPGYQGHRLSVGYRPDISPALINVNSHFKVSPLAYYDTPVKGYSFFALNVSHNFQVEYVMKRSSSVTGTVKLYRSGLVYQGYSEYDDFGNLVSSPDTMVKVSGMGINIGYRRFMNALAPMGTYWGYSIGFTTGAAAVPAAAGLSISKVKAKTLNLYYYFGKQRVLFDKVLMDAGFGFDIIGFYRGLIGSEISSYTANTLQEQYERKLKVRISARDALVLSIGGRYMF